MANSIGYPDSAILLAEHDQLGMSPYADSLAWFIATCDMPMTVAVQGGWGCGKTSLLNLVQAKLSDQPVETIWFNTWQFAQLNLESELTWSMLGLLLRKLDGDRSTTDLLDKLRGAAVNAAKLAGGMAANVALNQLGLSLGGRGNPVQPETSTWSVAVDELTQLRDRLRAAVDGRLAKTSKQRVIVFVDDLDRLPPRRAVELLEVVKVFLDLPRCVFVLAVDYGIVTSGVRDKYPGTDDMTGRRFFDKLIQVPFVVPEGQFQHDKYLSGLLRDFESTVPGIGQDAALYADFVGSSIGFNPRAVKRVFNAFILLTKVRQARWESRRLADDERRIEASLLFGALCASNQFEKLYQYLISHPDAIQSGWFTEVGSGEGAADVLERCGLGDPAESNRAQGLLRALWEATTRGGDPEAGQEQDDERLERLRETLRMASIASASVTQSSNAVEDDSGEIDDEKTETFCRILEQSGKKEFAGRLEVCELVMKHGLPRPDWFVRSDVFRPRRGVYRAPSFQECQDKAMGYRARRPRTGPSEVESGRLRRAHQQLLALAKEKGGYLAKDDPELRQLLGDQFYRLGTQLSPIRRVFQLHGSAGGASDIVTKYDPQGGRAIGYEFSAFTPAAVARDVGEEH